jgi:hypothetical protein
MAEAWAWSAAKGGEEMQKQVADVTKRSTSDR